MDQQTKFKTALAALAASAETKDRKLTKADVKEFLEDMGLGEEQMKLVYAYLASKHIHVEGAELPKVEDTPYSQEEQEFLKQYEKDRKAFRQCAEEEKAGLFAKAADGDVQAKHRLAEHYMNWVLEIAEDYAHRGMMIQDLIQEGNIGLLIGLDTLGLMEEGLTSEEHLEKEIRHAIRSALDEQEGEKSTGDEITEKLNKMADAISELTEDLGRQVSPDELSLYLDMSLEEIEDLLRIAGETIEVADSQKA